MGWLQKENTATVRGRAFQKQAKTCGNVAFENQSAVKSNSEWEKKQRSRRPSIKGCQSKPHKSLASIPPQVFYVLLIPSLGVLMNAPSSWSKPIFAQLELLRKTERLPITSEMPQKNEGESGKKPFQQQQWKVSFFRGGFNPFEAVSEMGSSIKGSRGKGVGAF